MRKLITIATAITALAAMPASAGAVGTWSGWQTSHSDNLASPGYPSAFGNNGTGATVYCVDPTTSSTHCGPSGVYAPVAFSGVLTAGGANLGCNHQDGTPDDPCTNGDKVGAVAAGGVGVQG